jgi:hypothetical protein
MFKEKAMAAEAKKEDVIFNMVLTLLLAIRKSITKNVVFKEKKPHKNKSLTN